ncbi:hypothetical protein AURDEDRAFT_178113 [Auricularia subglabra TFB-10046 SS5]|uniref:Uncharacterized protein n=1 Tax=Auricularia subglabra (strain TFB-10046 / SS5) TaxID=717982 RepID=J0L8U4_AURST|nr:hypothetical protein AURDEDRAFT_178113 [Auricularia subglabra TFB-10046 SS5]
MQPRHPLDHPPAPSAPGRGTRGQPQQHLWSNFVPGPLPGVSKSASPRRGSRDTSPCGRRRCTSESASPRRGSRDATPPRRGLDGSVSRPASNNPSPRDADSEGYWSPYKAPSLRWTISPAPRPPFKGTPKFVEVAMHFTDTEFRAHVIVPHVQEDLHVLDIPQDLLDQLHIREMKYATLTCLHADGTWHQPDARPLHIFHDDPDSDTGYVYLRARTMGDLTIFPASYYADMAERLKAFRRFTGDRHHPMRGEEAFFALFNYDATPAEIEQLEMCLSVVETSPPQLREKYEHAGRTPKGTWAEFVQECELHKDTPASTKELCNRYTLSPDLGASPKSGSSRRYTLSPDLGAEPEPASPGAPTWRGLAAGEASSSGHNSQWDDEDDLYD